MARVGFIGVGNMGGPMARNLIKAGHSLKVYDLSDEAVSFAIQSGAWRALAVIAVGTVVTFAATPMSVPSFWTTGSSPPPIGERC